MQISKGYDRSSRKRTSLRVPFAMGKSECLWTAMQTLEKSGRETSEKRRNRNLSGADP